MSYPADPIREMLSAKYLSGSGIEIGALCHPLQVNGTVKYVDRFDRDGLHDQYPEIPTDIMVPVDIVDDGETLARNDNGSQDFVIANHFLEHCKNPILTVENWRRVLKPGGIIFCAVPNKNECFDKERYTTNFEHVEEEYLTGETNDIYHYDENGIDSKTNYSIHYHCWDASHIAQFWRQITKYVDVEVLEHIYNPLRQEFIYIVRKK